MSYTTYYVVHVGPCDRHTIYFDNEETSQRVFRVFKEHNFSTSLEIQRWYNHAMLQNNMVTIDRQSRRILANKFELSNIASQNSLALSRHDDNNIMVALNENPHEKRSFWTNIVAHFQDETEKTKHDVNISKIAEEDFYLLRPA